MAATQALPSTSADVVGGGESPTATLLEQQPTVLLASVLKYFGSTCHVKLTDKALCCEPIYGAQTKKKPWTMSLKRVLDVSPHDAKADSFTVHYFPIKASKDAFPQLEVKHIPLRFQCSDERQCQEWLRALRERLIAQQESFYAMQLGEASDEGHVSRFAYDEAEEEKDQMEEEQEKGAKKGENTVGIELKPVKRKKKRSLLVLLNPFSGRGKALKIWESVEPYFKLASFLSYTKIETKYAGHAEEIAHTVDPDEHQGIVVVSGDGLLHEVLNGLLHRKDWAEAVRKVAIGIIPAGSGNGLAASIGCLRPESAAFTILKGYSHPLDIFTVLQPNETVEEAKNEEQTGEKAEEEEEEEEKGEERTKDEKEDNNKGDKEKEKDDKDRQEKDEEEEEEETANCTTLTLNKKWKRRYGFLQVSWGLVSDIDFESETMRWMGGVRFQVTGLLKLLGMQLYPGRVAYLLPESDDQGEGGGNAFPDKPPFSPFWKRETHPRSSSSSSSTTSPSMKKNNGGEEEEEKEIGPPLLYIGNEETEENDERTSTKKKQNWIHVNDEFVGVVVSNTPLLSADAAMAPYGMPDDGALDLAIIRRTTRGSLLKTLTQLETGEHIANKDFEYCRAVAVKIFPEATDRVEDGGEGKEQQRRKRKGKEKVGKLGIDGEQIPCQHVELEIHPHLVNLFYPLA